MNLPFSEMEPSYDEGRTLLNGNTLDKDNQVVEAPPITADELGVGSSHLIEEEKGEMQFA